MLLANLFMAFRILVEEEETGVQVIRLAGQLGAEGAAELARVLAGLSGPARLDLADLRRADEAGLAALRALRVRGTALSGASPYLRLQLEVVSPEEGGSAWPSSAGTPGDP